MVVRSAQKWILIAALGFFVFGCKSGDFAVPAVYDRPSYTIPEQTEDGWLTASMTAVGLNQQVMQQLTDKIARQEYPNVHSVLVVKNGYLVYEEYFTGIDFRWGKPLGLVPFDRDTLHDLRSVTKSITSAIIGMAVREQRITTVDRSIFDFLPQYGNLATPFKRKITLRHALTMTAGLDWDESSVSYRDSRNSASAMARASDPVKFVLERQTVEKPGVRFTYNGGLTTVLGAIVHQTTGVPIDEYAQAGLFSALGIQTYEWVTYRSGIPVSASGLRLRPRDLAKLGFLYLNHGKWQNRQILSPQWIAASLKPRVTIKENLAYGYQWWIDFFSIPGSEYRVYEASGNGGQRIYVVPGYGLLAVITAGNYDIRDRDTRMVPWRILVEHLLPAAGAAVD